MDDRIVQHIPSAAVGSGSWAWIRLSWTQVPEGIALRLRTWLDGAEEPDSWQAKVIDHEQMDSPAILPTHVGLHGGHAPIQVDDLMVFE